MRTLIVLLAALAALVDSPAARADDDARARAVCTASSEGSLRLRTDEGRLRIEFELRNRGAATQWNVVIVRERRIAWRGTVRTGRRATARVRRSYPDWFGTDHVSVRAIARRGETCRAAATV